jgi:AIR synthase-related protein
MRSQADGLEGEASGGDHQNQRDRSRAEADLEGLVQRLFQLEGLQGKRDIQAPASLFAHQPFPSLGAAAALGDDAALVPAAPGPLLLACEGLHPQLVVEDPWFAGWSAVLVNLNDIAAMGGRPLALVNSLWSQGPEPAQALLEGMGFACDKFGVPMVGGHTNLQSPYTALSVAVLGTAPGPVLSARLARPGQICCLLANHQGAFHRHYPFWDAATQADPQRLRAHLELLVQLAAAGVVRAAKDVSMGGIAGTAVMLAEAAGCHLQLDLDAIESPPGVALEAWLTCFPSYGFLLVVDPGASAQLAAAVAPHPELWCGPIGRFGPGPVSVALIQAGARSLLWPGGEALTGFTASPR